MASLFTRPCTSPATMQASKISSAGQFTALPLSSPRPRRCLMQLRAPAAAFGSGSGVCDATGNLKLHSGSARAAVCTRAVRAGSTADASDALALQHIAEITRQVDAALATILQDNAESAQQPRQQHSSPLRSKVVAAIDKLSKGLLERETEVRLLLLSALCGEHLLLLGPPGTAKSELSRRLNSLVGGTYYERLLTRFSVPEELFGPLSMRGLENDQYVRQTDGYLPTAEVAFVDEIFKANSAILNALLTLLNERLFDNGNQRHKAPLMTLVGASNELPESEELDALYDRFLIRRQVAQVSNSQLAKLARMAAGRPDPVVSTATAGEEISHLTVQEFKDAPDQAYAEVDVPDSVVDIIVNLRNYLQDKCEPPIYVSDRRFMKAIQMLQVVAFGDGRDEVTEFDCLLLEHVFGNRPDDCHKVRAHVLEIIASDPGLQQAELVFLGLFGRALRLMGPDTPSTSDLSEAVLEAGSLAALLRSRHAALALALDAGFPELKSSVWQSEGAVQGAVQGLTPQMTENRKKVEELLREALVLQACLERASTAVSAGQPAGPVGQLLERLLPKRLKQYQKGIAAPAATAGAK